MVKAYKQFKDKGQGFTVFSVSLDDDKERWTKAIAADGLAWPNHVSDLQKWIERRRPGLRRAGHSGQSFLLDPQGRIIAKNLRGSALRSQAGPGSEVDFFKLLAFSC